MGRSLVYALVGSEGAGPLLDMSFEGNFQVTMWRHRWRHHHENTFWGRSSHIWCQNEAVFDISKFSKWQSFWGHNKLFLLEVIPEVIQEVEYARIIAMGIYDVLTFDRRSSWNIDGYITILKFDLFMTSLMTS